MAAFIYHNITIHVNSEQSTFHKPQLKTLGRLNGLPIRFIPFNTFKPVLFRNVKKCVNCGHAVPEESEKIRKNMFVLQRSDGQDRSAKRWTK